MKALTDLHDNVNHFLHRPKAVAMWCLVLSLSGLLLEGSLLSWMRLLSEEKVMSGELLRLKSDNTRLKLEVGQTRDPKLIEREARERLDLVQKNDLIFVFSDGE